jgi:hypothetical protein
MVYSAQVHSSEASVLSFDVHNISGQASLKQLKLRQMQVRKGGLPPLKTLNSEHSLAQFMVQRELSVMQLERGKPPFLTCICLSLSCFGEA